MRQINWLKSLTTDTDGNLVVEIESGIRLYDALCKVPSLPGMSSMDKFRPTLNEINGIIYCCEYDADYCYKKGDVIVDAGARIGTFTVKSARAIGVEGKVIAIEPEPTNFSYLLKNIEANGLTNVIAVRKMLWSRKMEMELNLSMFNASHSAFQDKFYNCIGKSVVAKADTLDNILRELGVKTINFVKMDIEGSEVEALEGMAEVLAQDVQLAIAAYHPVDGRPTSETIIPRLKDLGFMASCTPNGMVRAKK